MYIDSLWKLQNFKGPKIIYLNTETPKIINDAIAWGKKNNWQILYNPLQIDIFKSKGAKYDNGLFVLKSIDYTFHHHYNLLEYISQIINYSDLMSCNAFVCTQASNTCRIFDELRATIGGKPSSYFADISEETCNRIPCVDNDDIKSFDW